MNEKISVIICTYNGEKLVKNCINSILKQSHQNFEILCMDGGSKDKTIEMIKKYEGKDKRVRYIHNPNKLPEGKNNGKSLGFERAHGDIICFMDQDNVLQGKSVFSRVINVFRNEDNSLLGVLAGLTHDRNDSAVVRYVSLFGTDSFFAYRSMDFLRNIKKPAIENGLEVFSLTENNLSITGGNCFFYKRENLAAVGGYSQDILVVRNLVRKRINKLLVLPNATKHFAERSLWSLVKKKFFWGSAYFRKNDERFSYLPATAKEAFSFLTNLTFNLLIVPNLIYSLIIYSKTKDSIAFLYLPIAFLNTIAYGFNFLKNKLHIS